MLHVLLAELCPVVVQPVTPHRHNLAPVVLISGSRLSGSSENSLHCAASGGSRRCTVGCGGEHRTGSRRAPWPAPRPYCSFTIINIKNMFLLFGGFYLLSSRLPPPARCQSSWTRAYTPAPGRPGLGQHHREVGWVAGGAVVLARVH